MTESGRSTPLITLSLLSSEVVLCVRVDDSRLYLPSRGSGCWTVRVYTLDGKTQFLTWKHEDTSTETSKLVVVNRRIYIPSREEKKMLCYSLTGDRVTDRDIYVEKMTRNNASLSATQNHQIIMAQAGHSSIRCICADTGSIVWAAMVGFSVDGMAEDLSGLLCGCGVFK